MENLSKKILFVGMPDMALICFKQLIENNMNIVGIIPPKKTNNTFSMMQKISEYYNIPFLPYDDLKDKKFIKSIKKLGADIGVVCSFNQKLPKEFLKTTKDGFLNCHPSLLPNYRGGNPYSAVIMNNELKTGITIHFMDENFDTGDIVTQIQIPLDKNETMGTLFNKSNFACAEALTNVLLKYEENGTLERIKQPDGEFPKATNFSQNSYKTFINWHKSANEIETLTRALNPFISAKTTFRHTLLKVHSCECEYQQTNLTPGTICDLSKGLGISCLDGIIHIKILEYGTNLITDGHDFVKRFSPKIGERMG